MDPSNGISFGRFDEFMWIRCEGKGSFLQSPSMKECASRGQEDGDRHFVIDLEACTGMDSTFMGFLAGLASKVARVDGWVQIASPGDRNRRSLEDLGLDCLLEIAPTEAPWRGREDEIRGKLQPYSAKRLPDAGERARHVLESHKTLAATSEDNARRFAGVLQVLEKEVSAEPESEG